MIKKYAVRLKGSDKFLSTKPSSGSRGLVHVQDAALWTHRGHARLALNYHSNKKYPLEVVEFGVLLVATDKGYIG